MNRRLRIIVAAPFAPRLDASMGGPRAIAQMLSHLAPRHDVGLLYLRGPGEPLLDDALSACCSWTEEVVRQPAGSHRADSSRPPDNDRRASRMIRARVWKNLLFGHPAWVTEWESPEFRLRLSGLVRSWQPEIVQFEFHVMAQYAAALGDSLAARILTHHEPGTSAAVERIRAGKAPGILFPRLDARAWSLFEKALLQRMDRVVVFTDRDRDELMRLAPDARVVTIPLGGEVPALPLSALGQEQPALLYYGDYAHTPNIHAAQRLAINIFPQLSLRYPALTLALVGANPPAELKALASERIAVPGRVADVRVYLDRASVVVVPLSLGGGMRLKVIEALVSGKAVVASPRAVEGLAVRDGEHLLIARTDEDFVLATSKLLDQPEERQRLGTAARGWARQHLSWDRSILEYEHLYTEVLADRGAAVTRPGHD